MDNLNLITGVAEQSIQKTMSSLGIVQLINNVRQIEFEQGKTKRFVELRHDHFMVKVPEVLGDSAPKFLGTAFYEANGAKKERNIYNFPERESWLMAMSYSYALQAYIYDALQDQFAENHDLRLILEKQTKLEKVVKTNGTTWGKAGIEQKKNKQSLAEFADIVNKYAQLKLF